MGWKVSLDSNRYQFRYQNNGWHDSGVGVWRPLVLLAMIAMSALKFVIAVLLARGWQDAKGIAGRLTEDRNGIIAILLSFADDPVHSNLSAALSSVSLANIPHLTQQRLDLLDPVIIEQGSSWTTGLLIDCILAYWKYSLSELSTEDFEFYSESFNHRLQPVIKQIVIDFW